MDWHPGDELPYPSRKKVFHTKAHERQFAEKYYTPDWVTLALLPYLPRNLVIWEPACGNGAMSGALQTERRVFVSDLFPDDEFVPEVNFLTAREPPSGDTMAIITNPPYGTGGRLAFQFCHHALRLMHPRYGFVAMLLRDDFDSAGGRRMLFADCPAWHHKLVLTKRIRWTNLEQKAAGPANNHAWFIWDWSRDPGPATLGYAP